MQKQIVLLIEDEAAIADTIVYALSTEGLNPVWNETAESGLATFRSGPVDLILIDIGLPDMNGFDLLKIIRSESTVPVIFLTARNDEIDKVVGLELGADDYITKPFSPRELTARVKANLRRRSLEQSESPLHSTVNKKGTFQVIEEKKQIIYFKTILLLSASEYRILKLLVENPGRVYSRDMILEMAWDDTSSVYDRTVDAHIKSIRAKLREVNNDVDPIITHRGFGYSMQETV